MKRSAHIPIEDLELSRRAYNCLKRNELHTVGDVLAAGSDALMRINNFGDVSLAEVTRELAALGHTLTEHGQPTTLPAHHGNLAIDAAALVDLLGLSDTPRVRRGLARVLRMVATASPAHHGNLAIELERTP